MTSQTACLKLHSDLLAARDAISKQESLFHQLKCLLETNLREDTAGVLDARKRHAAGMTLNSITDLIDSTSSCIVRMDLTLSILTSSLPSSTTTHRSELLPPWHSTR